MLKLRNFGTLILALQVTAFAAVDPGLLRLVMPDAKVIAGLQVRATKNSLFGQYVLSHMQIEDAAFKKFIAQTGFDPRSVDERTAARAVGAKFRHDVVALVVVGEQVRDRLLWDTLHGVDEIADAEAVDREPKLQLRFDLVALGDRDVAHVVADPRDLQPRRLVPAARCP